MQYIHYVINIYYIFTRNIFCIDFNGYPSTPRKNWSLSLFKKYSLFAKCCLLIEFLNFHPERAGGKVLFACGK